MAGELLVDLGEDRGVARDDVGGYVDEWAATIADEEKLKRFVSFVNAPDVPDPTITFVDERGQIRPKRPVQIAGPTLEVVGR